MPYCCSQCNTEWDYVDDADTCCKPDKTCVDCGEAIDCWSDGRCRACSRDTSYYYDFEAKISRTFAKLEDIGIFAHANWQCCQSCGCAAIPENGGYRGYTFYHEQDKDSAIEESCNGARVKVWLAYGALGPDKDNQFVSIGNEIKTALEEDGFTVDWNGDAGRRMIVNE